jgi:hypothetical protein
MITTAILHAAHADRAAPPPAGRFGRASTPRRIRGPLPLHDAVRAGEYAVDAHAVAAALLDRLVAGGAIGGGARS